MIDGAAHLMTAFHGLFAAGEWSLERGTNLMDGSAPPAWRGEHGREVLAELGLGEEEIVELFAAGVVAEPDLGEGAR
jgi:hypothetical protein